jgi:sodium-dependent dicarboxylate transporter 2/3/5
MLFITWWVITKRYAGKEFSCLTHDDPIVDTKKQPLSYEEKVVAAIFSTTALLWIFRNDLIIGSFNIPGWSGLFDNAKLINDGTIAITAALLLFILPTKNSTKYKRIADANTISSLPWNIVLLFGGGFALAKGFTDSGLSEFFGQQFIVLKDMNTLSLIAGISSLVVFLTEVTSNTATAQMLLPMVASVAQAIEINPLLLMIPVTLSASMAFMMPIATPPNAIVFASGKLRIRDMITTGFIINIIAIILITFITYFWGMQLFSIDSGSVPDWVT